MIIKKLFSIFLTSAMLVMAQLETTTLEADNEGSEDQLDQLSIEVRPGDEAELRYTTSYNIKLCEFSNPYGDTFLVKKNNSYSFRGSMISYAGENESTDCGVRITGVQENDNGEWKCNIISKEGNEVAAFRNAFTVIVSRRQSDVTATDSPIILRGPSNRTVTIGDEVSYELMLIPTEK